MGSPRLVAYPGTVLVAHEKIFRRTQHTWAGSKIKNGQDHVENFRPTYFAQPGYKARNILVELSFKHVAKSNTLLIMALHVWERDNTQDENR